MPNILELTGEIDASNFKAWNIVRTDPSSTLATAEKNLAQSKELGYEKGIAWSLGNIGAAYTWLSEYDKALENCSTAVDLLDQVEEYEQEVQMLYTLSIIFYFLGDFEKQLHYAFASLELSKKIGYRSGEANALNGIGTMYYSQQKNEEAIKHLTEAMEIAIEIDDKHTLSKIYDGLGQAYLHLKDYEKARDFKNKCLEVVNELGIKQVQSFAHDGLGEIYTMLNDYSAALEHLNEAIKLRTEMGFKSGVCESTIHKGMTYMYAGDNISSVKHFKDGLEMANELNSLELQYKAHKCLSEVYEKMGNLQLFVEHFKAYHELRDAHNNEKEDKKVKAFELKGKLEQIEKEKELLEEKIKERTEELEKSYRNTETLNKIGQELISTLNFDDIFGMLYQNVNQLMDATVFGVRLLDEENQCVNYVYEYEKGKRLGHISIPLSAKNNYSVICIEQNKEIVINDHEVEYKKYVDEVMVVDGEFPYSLIFYPLRHNGKVFGVISVQSFEKHAYTDYHLNIVKTLAQYTGIAFSNARNYEIMEEKVRERTKEITRTYENTKLLSEIGKDITSQLSVEKIISTVYERINQLMDAEGFGIGILNEKDRTLAFPGYIESGERLDGSIYSLDDVNRMGVACFLKQQEIVINDFDNEYHKYISVDLKPQVGKHVTSLIYLPIRAKDKSIGVITVQSFEKDTYNDYHVNMLRSIGVYAGIALDNAGLYENMEQIVKDRTEEVVKQKEEIEEAYENTRLIGQISKAISESLSIEEIIAKVYDQVNNLMDATCFGIGIYNEEENSIVMPGFIENGKRMNVFSYNVDDERLAPWCFKNKKEIFIQNYFEEYSNYIQGIQAPVSGQDSTSIIYIPLTSKEKVVGVLTVQSYEVRAYSDYQMDILRGLAASIGSAIENAMLYENLEEKVKERTVEIVRQKEQIEKSYENTKLLSEIAKEISSELSSKDIISKVYSNINNLMDAAVFGIAVYREDSHDLYFSGAMENGESLDDFHYSIDENKIATVCFKESKEIVINNREEEYKNYLKEDSSAVLGENPVSMIYLPLISKEKKIGVITVQSFERDAYESYHLDILRSLSINIASALENASLYASMEDRVKERTAEIEKAYQDTRLLSQISKDIVQSLEVETIISSVYTNINTLLDATCFGIGIYDDSQRKIVFPGFIENGKRLENVEYSVDGDFLATSCFNQNKEVFIQDYNKEYSQFLEDDAEIVSGDETNSIIYLPLNAKNKVIGAITVQSYRTNAYSEYQLNILRSLATTIATAIDNAKLYENMEDKVRERTLELVQQKEIIEEKNKHITDSIRYAKRIQDATLPDEKLVRSYLEDSFVLFKPKDIVSGDFYWVNKVDDYILFAVVDCTGHGVPGAFLSLIGHNSLNQIVNELKIIQPANILEELNRQVYKTLQNNLEVTNIKDGMDMAICALNIKTNELQFSGAYNPLYFVRGGDIREIKGDKIAIGSGDIGEMKFTNNVIQLERGDCIYMFSDGYADQFGGPKGKKFKYSQFKDLLLNIHNKEMIEQQKLLNHMIEAWQGDLEQIDDICVIGFRK